MGLGASNSHATLLAHLDRDVKSLEELPHQPDRSLQRLLYARYQQLQRLRIALSNASRSASKNGQPSALFDWLVDQLRPLEARLVRAMEDHVRNHPAGKWLLSIHGIGPVLACGVLAHCEKLPPFPTAGALWRYAGLDPTLQWQQGQPRPYNARLKALCYNIGDSFCKTSTNPKSFYGRVYRSRKVYEQKKNERGDYRDLAIASLSYTKDSSARAYYEKGMLPPGRIELRARRYAVKLFLSHVQQVLYFLHYNDIPPKPYALIIPGKNIWIGPPNASMIPHLAEAFAQHGIVLPEDYDDHA